MAKLISKTYGDALLELVTEENSIDDMLSQVTVLKQVLGENPDFDRLMSNPRVDMEQKLEVIENVFRGRVSDELTGFLTVVVSKGRFSQIHDILEYFVEKVEELKGIGTAYVTTPLELSAAEKTKVEEKLLSTTGYKSMKMNYTIDESLIGGMRIRIGDRVVDSSISSKIARLKSELMNTMLE